MITDTSQQFLGMRSNVRGQRGRVEVSRVYAMIHKEVSSVYYRSRSFRTSYTSTGVPGFGPWFIFRSGLESPVYPQLKYSPCIGDFHGIGKVYSESSGGVS